MKTRTLASLLVLGFLAAPAWAGTGTAPARSVGAISPTESASLRALEDASLGSLRAGAVAAAAPIQDAERAELVAAEARSPELAALRAGDVTLSDHDMTIIAIVVGVIILILII